MIFNKLKRTWSHGYINYIPKFKETFPELSKINDEEMCDRFISLDIEFYSIKETPVKKLLRLTLPFALLTMFLMVVGLPFYFIITGNWGYSLKSSVVYNWFKALKLQ